MTDQSGAFPETLREAAQRILDRVGDYYDNEPPSCGVGCSQCCDTSLTVGDLRALRAALERPRPAPPEPSEEAKRAAEKAYWEASQRSDARRSAEVPLHVALEAAYAVDFGGTAGTGGDEGEVPSKGGGPSSPQTQRRGEPSGSQGSDRHGALDETQNSATADSAPSSRTAGTGAAPPDTVESLATWLDANDWWDFSTVELATRILKRLRGGAAQPPPSAPDEEEAELYEKAMDALKPFTEVGWTNLGGSDHYGELIMVSVLIGDLARARTAYHALLNYEDRNVDLEEGNRG